LARHSLPGQPFGTTGGLVVVVVVVVVVVGRMGTTVVVVVVVVVVVDVDVVGVLVVVVAGMLVAVVVGTVVVGMVVVVVVVFLGLTVVVVLAAAVVVGAFEVVVDVAVVGFVVVVAVLGLAVVVVVRGALEVVVVCGATPIVVAVTRLGKVAIGGTVALGGVEVATNGLAVVVGGTAVVTGGTIGICAITVVEGELVVLDVASGDAGEAKGTVLVDARPGAVVVVGAVVTGVVPTVVVAFDLASVRGVLGNGLGRVGTCLVADATVLVGAFAVTILLGGVVTGIVCLGRTVANGMAGVAGEIGVEGCVESDPVWGTAENGEALGEGSVGEAGTFGEVIPFVGSPLADKGDSEGN
jgi:hypothetical protein